MKCKKLLRAWIFTDKPKFIQIYCNGNSIKYRALLQAMLLLTVHFLDKLFKKAYMYVYNLMDVSNVPPTILDKWRRKAFSLTNELSVTEIRHQNEIKYLTKVQSSLMQDVNNTKLKIKENKKEEKALQEQQKLLETHISLLQKYLSQFQSEEKISLTIFQNIINTINSHRTEQHFDIVFPISKIDQLKKKLKTIPSPKKPKNLNKLELKLQELQKLMAQKEKEIEDREATISIFTKMIKSTKLLNALQAQWKGIEEEQKREAEDRQREDDLRNQLAQLQEFGLRKSNQKENKLKKSFEAKKLERDSLLKQEKSIQIEISTLQEKVKLSKDNASAEIEELQQKLNAQNEEIENMRNIIQNLENGLVFDKETNTEFQTQTLPTQFAPPPNQRTTQSTTNESLYSRLDALYEYANQLLNQN